MQFGAVAVAHHAFVGDDVQVTHLEGLGTLVGSTAKVGVDPREQFLGHEGFGHVVVRARLETEHDVDGLVASRDDHDRQVARVAQLLAGLKTRHARQHDVDDRDVGGHAREQRHAHLARGGVVDIEALAFEHQAKRRANVVVVFNDQYSSHGVSFEIMIKTSEVVTLAPGPR